MMLQERAVFYQKLHTGMASGMTLQQVLAAGLLPSALARQSGLLRAALDRGATVAAAFTSAGLVSRWEAELIRIGETNGRLDAVLTRLNAFYTAKVLQLRHIRAKLVTPMLTLVVAITVLPLPALANGILSPGTYFFRTLVSLLVVFITWRLIIAAPLESASPAVFNPLLPRVNKIVGDKNFFRRLFEVSFLDLLVLCLESGMDAAQALKLLQESMPGKRLAQQFGIARNAVRNSGSALGDALAEAGLMRNPQVLLFFRTCEATGTLHSDMRTYLTRSQDELASTMDYWIRRIGVMVYFGVAVFALVRIFTMITG